MLEYNIIKWKYNCKNFIILIIIIHVIIYNNSCFCGFFRIDFNQLAKPANLQNSAVLRMLEEEEARQRAGQAGK